MEAEGSDFLFSALIEADRSVVLRAKIKKNSNDKEAVGSGSALLCLLERV